MVPYYLSPDLRNAHVLVLYFHRQTRHPYSSNAGLGVNALHTVRVLRKRGIRADAQGVSSYADCLTVLQRFPTTTHCLIEAPWLSTPNMSDLVDAHPDTFFIMRTHSNIAFLQVEAGAVNLIREQLLLQETKLNFLVASNSKQLTRFLVDAYQAECLYLPNLYFFDRPVRLDPQIHDHRLLRIGSFGATRLLKNHISAAAASLEIARWRRCDLEFYINVNREEHGRGVLDAMRNLYKGLTYAKIVEVPWMTVPEFRRVVASMDLTMQPSMSETFNIVTADAAAEGVPSAVSNCIEWVPDHWHVDVDDVQHIARVGAQLLSDGHASRDGLNALTEYASDALRVWLTYLEGQPMEHAPVTV